MWLLDWLNDRWSRVTTWFGSFFWTAYYRLKYFWEYLNAKARDAYQWAVTDLLPKINAALVKARSYADGVISNLRSWVWSRVISIYNTIRVRTAELWEGIQAARSWAEGKAKDLYDKAHLELLQAKANLEVTVRSLIQSNLNPFRWVLNYKKTIEDLAILFSPENRTRVAALLGDWFGILGNFAVNPLGFTIGLIEPVFVDLAAWSLAYALGTEEAELPDPPSWSSLRPGRGGPAPSIPADVLLGLKAPLDHIYRSGYPFKVGHQGIDLGLERGDPVYAMHEGVVDYINEAFTGYGYQIVVRGQEFWTRYAHLDQINVRRGQEVQAGEFIGRGNSTGNSTGDHLHLEIKYRGQSIDPATVLGLK